MQKIILIFCCCFFSCETATENIIENDSQKATVAGVLTLPVVPDLAADYWVAVDNDLDISNGWIRASADVCGTVNVVNYFVENVPTGKYFLHSGVHINSLTGSALISGDYYGIYGGSLNNPPIEANVTVPDSGKVFFDMNLEILP